MVQTTWEPIVQKKIMCCWGRGEFYKERKIEMGCVCVCVCVCVREREGWWDAEATIYVCALSQGPGKNGFLFFLIFFIFSTFFVKCQKLENGLAVQITLECKLCRFKSLNVILYQSNIVEWSSFIGAYLTNN